MRELWYEFLQWYEANGIQEIIIWIVGAFVTIVTTVSRVTANKSSVKAIKTSADNKVLREQNENQINVIKQENQELKNEIGLLKESNSELKITMEKLVAMNYQILISARVDEKVKNTANKIMNCDIKTKEQKQVKEAVSEILEEVIETAKENVETNNVVGEFDPLLDTLLKEAKGKVING